MSGRRTQRSKWDLILDILKGISNEGKMAKKTRILQSAYMDWWNFKKYFAELMERGFVEEINDPVAEMIYGLTERGKELQRRLENVKEILK